MAFDTKNLAFKIAAQVIGSDQVKALSHDVTGLKLATAGIESSVKMAGTALKGFAAAFSASAIIAFTKSTIDMADGLLEASQRTGIAIGELSKLKTTAELSGISFEALQVNLRKLNVNMSEAAGGSKQTREAFAAVGISVKELSGLKADQALKRIADAFATTEDGANKVRIASELLGKSGPELINFLNEGSAGITKFGVVINEQFAKDADKFNDSMQLMKSSFSQLSVQTVGPFIEPLAKAFTFWTNKVDGFTTGLKAMAMATRFAVEDFKKGFSETGLQRNARRDGERAELKKLQDELAERQQGRYNELFKGPDLTVKFKLPSVGNADAGKEREKRQKEIKKEEDSLKSYLATQKESLALRGLELNKLDYTESEYQKLLEVKRYNAEVDKESVKYTGDRLVLFEKETAAIHASNLALKEKEDAQERSYGVGARRAIRAYVTEAERGAKLMEDAFTGSINKLEDSLVAFVQSGKFNFKELADFIVAEMLRITIKQAVIAPVLGALGSVFGSASTASGTNVNGPGFTDGATVTSRSIGPQALTAGRGLATQGLVATPDGGTNISVVVNMNGNQQDSTEQASSQFGERLGKMISNVVKLELIQQSRPGGLLRG